MRGFSELESLRNNLAHAQVIATHDWAAIARIAEQLEGLAFQQRSTAKIF